MQNSIREYTKEFHKIMGSTARDCRIDLRVMKHMQISLKEKHLLIKSIVNINDIIRTTELSKNEINQLRNLTSKMNNTYCELKKEDEINNRTTSSHFTKEQLRKIFGKKD